MNEPLKTHHQLLLNFAIGLGTFIQILDSSIANVAIPYIAGNLSVSSDDGTWVITAFAASNSLVLPLTGWLSDFFGRVRLFVWSVLLFALASFLCGLSTNLTMLVFFRVLQGAVAGSLIPLSQSLLVASNPVEKQGPALGFWAMIVVVAPVVGPIVGGYLTYNYSWPWIFYINVPIGAFSAIVVWYYLHDKESTIVRNPIDWVGLFLLSLAVACTQITLDKGKDLDWFNSNFIIFLSLVAAISFGYFALWNTFQTYPIVDFSFFKNRNFVFGTLCITLGFLAYFCSTVITPLWLQTEQGYTPTWAGIAVAPVGVASVFLATTVGRLLNKVDLRLMTAASFVFFSIGFFYQASFTTEVNIEKIMLARFIQGFGIAFFFLPLTQLALGDIAKESYASAAGLFHFIRLLVGSSFGTSLSVYLWYRREVLHYERIGEQLTLQNDTTRQFYEKLNDLSPNFSTPVVNHITDTLVQQQAYMLATNDLVWLGAWLFILMIPLVFLCKQPKPRYNDKPAMEHA